MVNRILGAKLSLAYETRIYVLPITLYDVDYYMALFIRGAMIGKFSLQYCTGFFLYMKSTHH